MSSLNRTTLIGRMGSDPRITPFSDGSKVANFSLATSMKWKDAQGAQKEETEWHNVVIYGKAVEIVEQYVRKGDLLFVEGRGRTRKYTADGVEKYTHETVVAGFEGKIMLFPKAREQPPVAQQPEWAGGNRANAELPPGDIQPVPSQPTNSPEHDDHLSKGMPF